MVGLERGQRWLVGKVAALAVCDRDAQKLVGRNLVREGRISGRGLEENMLATELKRAIADERARQEPRFTQDLKTVADAQDKAPRRQTPARPPSPD